MPPPAVARALRRAIEAALRSALDPEGEWEDPQGRVHPTDPWVLSLARPAYDAPTRRAAPRAEGRFCAGVHWLVDGPTLHLRLYLGRALRLLPPAEAWTLRLLYHYGLSQAQVAALLRCAVRTVYNRREAALTRLVALLYDADGHPRPLDAPAPASPSRSG